jgi:hypothetical protein
VVSAAGATPDAADALVESPLVVVEVLSPSRRALNVAELYAETTLAFA